MTDPLTTLTRRVLFAPLEEAGKTQEVVDRLRSAITLGIFADGEQLPNEVSLAKQLSVSPVTLRDAIKTIRQEGLVRTARGRSGGTFVITPDEGSTPLFEKSLAVMSELEIRDLLDWQTAVMAHAAKLAADRASAYEIRVLAETVQAGREAEDLISVRRRYSRFLIEVASSSRSSRVSRAAISLQIEMAPHATLALQEQGFRLRLLDAMDGVVVSVRERNETQARNLMDELMRMVGESVQRLHYDLTHPQPSGAALPEAQGKERAHHEP